jgi:RHS repeat-associated protein
VDDGSEFQAIIGSGSSGEDWRYDYFIKDHLGNTRVVFSDLISDNEIIAEFQYNPCGLRMDGDWAENTSLNNEKYQYNGIEYLQDHGLNINMARYRMFDPGLGRWLSLDPYTSTMIGIYSLLCDEQTTLSTSLIRWGAQL